MTDLQLPDALVLFTRQQETADILQRALMIAETSSNLDEGVWLGNHINQALNLLGYYCKQATDEHRQDMDACLSAAASKELDYIELAKAYQDAAQHLQGAEACEAGVNLNSVCNGRYRADIAAAIVRGDVDSSLALWASFFINSWTHCGGLDLLRELIKVHRLAEADVIRYLQTDAVIATQTPDERQQVNDINQHGATIYRGAVDEDVTGLCWTLSEDIARGFAERHSKRVFDSFIYTAQLKPGGALLYLTERDEQELVVNPDYLTITAEEWIAE